MSRRRRAAVATLGACLALASAGVPARAAPAHSVSLSAGLSSFYDDNILQYSSAQIADFESGAHPDRFSIESRDDLVLAPYVALAWRLDQGRGRRHVLRLKSEGSFHDKNGTADSHSFSVGWREGFRGGHQLALGYYTLPHYYLRQLLDEDAVIAFPGLSRYRRAALGLRIGSAAWTQRLGRRNHLLLGYQYEQRSYNADFRERDSGLHQGVLELGRDRMPRHGGVDAHGGYQVSHARASDSDEVAGTTPDDADLSYHGILAGAGGRMDFVRGRRARLGGDLAYEFETRRYESDRPADKYHFGRHDARHTVELGLRAVLRSHWALRGFYHIEDNAATLGSSAPIVSDAGSYRQNQVGLAFEWTGLVWRKAREAAAGEGEGDN